MKRFTETDKWRDTWFRQLKPLSKLAFLYIVENCDAAGVWDPDFGLADFAIGTNKIKWAGLPDGGEFGDRVVTLANGKWFLTRFVEFQYGPLVEECRPHAKVLKVLASHGIGYDKGIGRVSIPIRTGRRQEEDRTGQEEETEWVSAQQAPDEAAATPAAAAVPPAVAPALLLPFDSDLFRAAWELWCQHRREIKKPMTPTAAKMALKQLSLMGEPRAIRCIEHTIAKGWQGLREPDGVPVRPGQAPQAAIREPQGWKGHLNHTYPDSRFAAGQPDEAHEWHELPRDVQMKIANEVRRSA